MTTQHRYTRVVEASQVKREGKRAESKQKKQGMNHEGDKEKGTYWIYCEPHNPGM